MKIVKRGGKFQVVHPRYADNFERSEKRMMEMIDDGKKASDEEDFLNDEEHEEHEEPTEKGEREPDAIDAIIDATLDGKPAEVADAFNAAIADKIAGMVDDYKVHLANTMLDPEEEAEEDDESEEGDEDDSEESDDSDEDEKEDEESEEEEDDSWDEEEAEEDDKKE